MTANIERSWRVAALAALLLGGCTPAASTGDAGRGGDGGGSAGLVGTWGAMQCSFCASSDCVSCDQSYTFGADGSLVLALSATYSTSASSFPGCTITMRDTGYLYTATSTQITTATTSSAIESMGRTGCVNDSDDRTLSPDPTFDPNSLVSTLAYTLSGSSLSLGTSPATILMRR